MPGELNSAVRPGRAARRSLQEAATRRSCSSAWRKHVCRVADVERSCIFVRDRSDPRSLIAAAGHGTPIELLGSRIGADEGVLGRVLATGEPLLVRRLRRARRARSSRASPRMRRARRSAPIHFERRRRRRRCVAGCDEPRPERLGEARVELLCRAGRPGGRGARPREQRATTFDASDAARTSRRSRRRWTCATGAPREHSEDVVRARRAWSASCSSSRQPSLLELEFAARLHDVGKIRVPDAVLNKPGPLDADEREVMRCHSAWGAETLSGVPGLEVVATIVRFHHERWDGARLPGRPAPARASRWPAGSSAVCDAFGAMTCDRPYRDGDVARRGARRAARRRRHAVRSRGRRRAVCEAVATTRLPDSAG